MNEHSGYDGGITTGFASPAEDSLEGPIDLAEILDLNRPDRYPVRVQGEALTERGILSGDILITDAAAPPRHGRIAIVMIQGEVLVAQLAYKSGEWWMKPGRARSLGTLIPHDAEIWAELSKVPSAHADGKTAEGIVCGLVRTEV